MRGETGEAQAGRCYTRKGRGFLVERSNNRWEGKGKGRERGQRIHPVLKRGFGELGVGGLLGSNFREREILSGTKVGDFKELNST